MLKFIPIIITSLLVSCVGKSTQPTNQSEATAKSVNQLVVTVPIFNADSAFDYTAKQVAFGPRVPLSKAHLQCVKYLSDKLKQLGAEVIVQEGEVTLFNKEKVNCKNIIGQFNQANPNRIVLFSHWDSRPFADQDENVMMRNVPIDGASDGASGVAVLLEIARNLGKQPSSLGVDVVFLDIEDYGQPDFLNLPPAEESWCLGTQYWGKKVDKSNYAPRFGILLDMVGAKDALFYKEGYSMQYAPQVVDLVWRTASDLGFGNRFINDNGGTITDDHVSVNQLAGIPTIDIIQFDPTSNTSFGKYWHTHQDNMSIIDKNTLSAIGQTLMQVIYSEK